MTKRKFYKLGEGASVFYDSATRLKVTKNVPGSVLAAVKPGKQTTEAGRNGHIQEIDADTWREELKKLNKEELQAALEEQGVTKEEFEGKTSSDDDDEDKEKGKKKK